MERMVIIDGNAILHRAYHALPEWRNQAGEATSGVYGFFSMLLKVRDEFSPKYLAVAFDHPSPTFRHQLYVGYQHGRTKDRQMEEDIWGQVEKLEGWLSKGKAAVFQIEGFEADDVIGSLAKQATKGKKVEEAIAVTGDRDLFQLVDKKVKIYMPVKGLTEAILFDEEGVKGKMGVEPEQIIEYKALVGVASDSYPGVPGIGPVTAVKLLAKYKTVAGIYKNLDKIEEGTVKKLIDGQEGAEVSRQLAIIKTDVPVTLNLEEAVMPSDETLVGLFEEMNYPSLIKRITGESELTIASKNEKKAKKKKESEGQLGLV